MNWIKQAYMNTAEMVEQRPRTDNAVYFNFDANASGGGTRVMSFYSGAGQTIIQVEVNSSEAMPLEVELNGLPAGDFAALSFVLDVWLKEGINTLSIIRCGADSGMVVKVTGNKLEKILKPLNVVGNTEFGESCLLYSSEEGKLMRYMVAESGEISRERVFGYTALDAKYFRSENGEKLRMVSAGLDVTGNLIYTDADSIALADNVKEAAIVEKQDGGVYILYLKDEKINIIQADVSGQFTYYYNMLDKVESVRSAVSGSVFLYKTKEKWQSGEFARYDNSRFDGCISLNGELPSIGDTYVKLTMLNAVNRPNAACENEKTIYYLYRNGSMYRTEGKANEVAAYCEFYIPFKTGGVMVWSKKLCVSRQGA